MKKTITTITTIIAVDGITETVETITVPTSPIMGIIPISDYDREMAHWSLRNTVEPKEKPPPKKELGVNDEGWFLQEWNKFFSCQKRPK